MLTANDLVLYYIIHFQIDELILMTHEFLKVSISLTLLA